MTTDTQIIIDMATQIFHERHSSNQDIDLDAIRDEIEIELVERVDPDIIKKAHEAYLRNPAASEQYGNVEDEGIAQQTKTDGITYSGITRYDVIRKKHLSELVQSVRNLIKLGWTPLGGVSFVAAGMSPIGDTGNSFIQAMVKS